MKLKNINIYLAAALLLLAFSFQAVSSIWPGRKSPTCDELAHHIPVGYILLEKGDFKMDPSQPPLPRYIAALPLKLFMDIDIPDNKEFWRREERQEFGKEFFYKYVPDPEKALFYSRMGFVMVGILCGIVLFLMARAFYGEKAAVLSLFLYSFCPNILAHTGLSTIDMTATFSTLLSIFIFWVFTRKSSLSNAVFAGCCLGLAQLSKYTSLLLYPLFIILFFCELPAVPRGERGAFFVKLLLVFAVSMVVTWAGYGFDFEPILANAMRVDEKISIAHNIAPKIIPFWRESFTPKLDAFLKGTPLPLGTHLLGILGVIRHTAEGHSTYFMGKWSGSGNPLYFLVAFLIKTPVPALFLFFSGLFLIVRTGIKRNERFLLFSVLFIFVTASMSKLQLGLRYILPVYPLCFVIASRSVEYLHSRIYKSIFMVMAAWYVISAVIIWPDHLSYFNEFIGGPKNGYKYLRDSNIDWGQDLPSLAGYMKRNNIDSVKLMYFGTADPEFYGIDHKPLAPEEKVIPAKEVYAISVHKLDAVPWTREYEPSARAGYSIYIYDFRRERGVS